LHEHEAKARICSLLKAHNFSIKDVRGLPTAFVASYGKGRPRIALLAEYDALEGLGHACGHHLISGMSTLAAIGLTSIVGPSAGTIVVVGCPAEETIGAKALLVKKGVFKSMDAAMMIHPADKTEVVKLSLSLERFSVVLKGISSHASANPWNGKNALTGMLSLFQAIDINRITMPDGDRINGIIKRGGSAANIIPDRAEAEFFIRAKDLKSHAVLVKRFFTMVRGTARAFGLGYEMKRSGNVYYPLEPNMQLARIFEKQLKKLRVKVDRFFTDKELGSSDIGNVSHVVPAIHPTIAITGSSCPAHSEAFKRQANKPAAYRIMRTGAMLLALTAFELYKNQALLLNIKKEHYIKYS
jgi:amidohydrolase